MVRREKAKIAADKPKNSSRPVKKSATKKAVAKKTPAKTTAKKATATKKAATTGAQSTAKSAQTTAKKAAQHGLQDGRCGDCLIDQTLVTDG